MFDLESRAAPGLYVAAWLLSAIGAAAAFIGLAAESETASPILFVAGMVVLALGLAAGSGSQALQRRADGRPGYAGPSPFLVFGVIATGGQALAVVLILAGPGLSDQLLVLLSTGILAALGAGALALLVVGSGALSWREMGLRIASVGQGALGRDVAWGMALAVPTFVVAVIVAVALTGLLGVMPEETVPMTSKPVEMAWIAVALVVVAPAWEELFFRGFATTAWARTLGPRSAVVRGALFFALIHVLTTTGPDFGSAVRVAAIAFGSRLPVGLILGWVFLRRRSLAAPIALHATYNALPLLLFIAVGSAAPTG